MTDRELLDAFTRPRVAAEREQAFAELLQRYWRLVYAAALRILNDTHLAEDTAQSVFMLLAHRAALLPAQTVLSGWLYASTLHVARNAARKRQRMIRRQQQMQSQSRAKADVAEGAAPMQEPFDWCELKPHIDRALAALPQPQRDAIVLRLILQRPHNEAARELRCSKGALAMRLNRGLETLREKLKRLHVEVSAGALSAALLQNGIPPALLAGTPPIPALKLPAAKAGVAKAGVAKAGVAKAWIEAGVGAVALTAALFAGALLLAMHIKPAMVRALSPQSSEANRPSRGKKP